MIIEKENTTISKFLSLVLRHKPDLIGIELDGQGWVKVTDLLTKASVHGRRISAEALQHVVASNAKKRFSFDDTGLMIRASQGHSVDVDLGYKPQMPPDVLYHGTGSQSVQSILANGIEKRNRRHVHLSADVETAVKVGHRHGKPVVLTIITCEMQGEGFSFYLSANGVWLVDEVPPQFIKLME